MYLGTFGQERFICNCDGFSQDIRDAITTDGGLYGGGMGGRGRYLNAIKVVIRCRFHFLRDDVDGRSFVIAPTSSRGLHDLLPPFPFSRPPFPAVDFFVTIRACDVRPPKMNVFP